jgi:hypothetical protein
MNHYIGNSANSLMSRSKLAAVDDKRFSLFSSSVFSIFFFPQSVDEKHVKRSLFPYDERKKKEKQEKKSSYPYALRSVVY